MWPLAAASLTAGCAGVQTDALRAGPRSLAAALPARVELVEVPFFPQTDYHCGPAALATALVAEGVATTPDDLADAVYLPARQGSLQTEMLSAARRVGAVATRLPPRLEPLLRELASGHAVVVFLNLGLSWVPAWHYAVLVGYDLPAGEVVLRSGRQRREVMVMRTFEHTWVRAGSWAFGVRLPGSWPQQAEEMAVLEASIGFERAADPPEAVRVYRSAVARWPDNLALQMGLANSLYAAGRKEEAAEAYKAAALLHASAPAWINRADTLLELGDAAGAAQALERAAALDDGQWRDELSALRARLAQRGRL